MDNNEFNNKNINQNTENEFNGENSYSSYQNNTESVKTGEDNSARYEYNGAYRDRSSNYRPGFGERPTANNYCNSNNYDQNYEAYVKPEAKPKQYASKGFVAVMLCISILLSGAVGFLAGLSSLRSLNFKGMFGSGTVVVDYAEKEINDGPVVKDEGISAYVASVAAATVVEVRTERVTTGSYFGQYVEEGAGSGVIIDSTGYIITCAHVIDGASKITVKLTNGDVHTAELVGSDPQTDIAVIKINVQNIEHATIGSSQNLVAGQHVVAIGNPLGELGGTITDGILSATNREISIGGAKYNLLQTNAAINPGNSGGGLFDDDGNLIGIVNAKSTGSSIEGLGFAIPIDEAMKIATNLMENGYISGRVKLGVELLTVDSTTDYRVFIQYGSIIDGYGIYIMSSETDSFEVGDKLIAIDGVAVSSLDDVKSLLLEYEPNEKVTVTVSRKNDKGRSEIIQIEHTLIEKTAVDYK